MNKLVSRNPILRFLYGKKILDTLAGIVSSQSTPLLPAYIMYKGYKKVQNDFDKIKKRGEYNLKIDNNNKRLSNKYNLTYHPKFEKVGDRKPVPTNKKDSFKPAQTNARNFKNRKGVGPTKKIGTFTISDMNPEVGEITPSEANALPKTSPAPPKPIAFPLPNLGYRTDFDYTGSNSSIRNFGFNNYLGLLNFVRENSNNLFAKDLTQRFGSVDKWNLNDVEGALGISGTYRRGSGGDYSDIMRSMAEWAGTQNGLYDRKKEMYNAAMPFFKGDYNLLNNGQIAPFYNPLLLSSLRRWLSYKKGGLISKNPINRFKNGSSFGKAFKAARALGLKEFIWNGNRYTTKTKEEELNNKIVNPFLKAEEEFQKKYKYQYNPYNSMTIYTNKNSGNKYLTSKTGRRADIIRT